MVNHRTPLSAFVVPLVLVLFVDGRRAAGLDAWPAGATQAFDRPSPDIANEDGDPVGEATPVGPKAFAEVTRSTVGSGG